MMSYLVPLSILAWLALLLVLRQSPARYQSRALRLAFIAASIFLLLGMGFFIGMLQSFATESSLAGCMMCVDLPAIGTFERAMSDFFRSTPGSVLLPLSVLGVMALISIHQLRRHEVVSTLVMLLVISFIYLIVSATAVPMLGWQSAEWLFGPRGNSPYTPLSYRLPLIALDFLALGTFLWALTRAGRWGERSDLLPDSMAVAEPA